MSSKGKHIHNEDGFTFSQPSNKSDYTPQQEYITRLDHYCLDLLDLLKDSYMLKLTELTNNSEHCLTWYRSTLTRRVKSLQRCPTGQLSHPKSTRKSSSTSKYARNCYILCMFLQGDKI